jgi:hypothetical protein
MQARLTSLTHSSLTEQYPSETLKEQEEATPVMACCTAFKSISVDSNLAALRPSSVRSVVLGFRGHFSQADPLSQFLQFGHSLQRTGIDRLRNLSAFRHTHFYRWTLLLDKTGWRLQFVCDVRLFDV